MKIEKINLHAIRVIHGEKFPTFAANLVESL